jgi:hypothetical protein
MLRYTDYRLLQFNVRVLRLELDFYIHYTDNANKALKKLQVWLVQ